MELLNTVRIHRSVSGWLNSVKASTPFKLAAFILLAYPASYYALSRYSYYRYKPVENSQHVFFYVPAEPVRIFTTNWLLRCHYYGSLLYYPVWFLDSRLFDGPQYALLE